MVVDMTVKGRLELYTPVEAALLKALLSMLTDIQDLLILYYFSAI